MASKQQCDNCGKKRELYYVDEADEAWCHQCIVDLGMTTEIAKNAPIEDTGEYRKGPQGNKMFMAERNAKIVTAFAGGMSLDALADEYKMSRARVYKIVKFAANGGN